MRKTIFTGVFAVLFTAALHMPTPKTNATGQYNASNALGQASGLTANYTQELVNNIQTPNSTGLSSPEDVAIDHINNLLFIADSANNRVVVHSLDFSNNLVDRSPDYVLGQADFTSNAATTTAEGLDNPTGVSVDAVNTNLFVADTDNNRVVIYDYSSISNGMAAQNVLGQADFTSNNSARTATGLNNPNDVQYDPSANRLFVSDRQNLRVIAYDVATITNGEPAVNVLGATDFTALANAAASGRFSSPNGLEIDTSNNLYISDSTYDRVLVFDITSITDGEDAQNVLGKSSLTDLSVGSTPSTAFQLDGPRRLSLNGAQDILYIADRQNSRVMVFDITAVVDGEDAVSVLGQADLTSYSSGANNVETSYPTGIAFNNDKLYVATNLDHRVLVFDVAAITNGEAAVNILGQTKPNGDGRFESTLSNDVHSSDVGLFAPNDVAVDDLNNRLFVLDWGNSRILVHNLDSNNNIVDHVADNVIGQADFYSENTDTAANRLDTPHSLAYDPIYDRLFVSDEANSRVLVYDVSTINDGENATHVLGQADFTTIDGSPTNSQLLTSPQGLALDHNRQLLFVNDAYDNRIVVFNVTTITNGEPALYVIGQTDFVSSGNSGVSATAMEYPTFLAYDHIDQILWVSDTWNNRMLGFEVASLSNGMAATYTLGAADLTTIGTGSATSASLSPYGATINEQERKMYVYDSNNRILIFDIANVVNGQAAEAVIGQADFTSSTNHGPTQSTVDYYGGLSFSDGSNILFAADAGHNRVLQFEFIRITTSSLSAGALGQAYARSIAATGSQGDISFALSAGNLPPGLSLSSAGNITGTPTQSGTYNFDVTAQDDNAISGMHSYTASFAITISADSDGDGVIDEEENAGPNSGDANGDGTPDFQQANVATATNANTNSYTTIESSAGNVRQFYVEQESELSSQNPTIDFPVGLNSFSVDGITAGSSAAVTVLYDKIYDTSDWTFMKYNATTSNYTNMDNAVTYGTRVVGSNTVTTATYILVDGGEFDEDGLENGTIVDPAGPAVNSGSVGVPNTGLEPVSTSTIQQLLQFLF